MVILYLFVGIGLALHIGVIRSELVPVEALKPTHFKRLVLLYVVMWDEILLGRKFGMTDIHKLPDTLKVYILNRTQKNLRALAILHDELYYPTLYNYLLGTLLARMIALTK